MTCHSSLKIIKSVKCFMRGKEKSFLKFKLQILKLSLLILKIVDSNQKVIVEYINNPLQ